MPFQTPEEPIRKYGSTASSLELAPSPTGPTSCSSGHEAPVAQQRARLVAAQAHRVPGLRLGDDLILVDHEHREVRVVAVVVGRRRLADVEVGEAGRRRPGGLLEHLEAAVDLARAGGDRVPEVRARLGIRVGQRADEAVLDLLQVLVDQVRRGAQLERLDGADVHHVTHRAGGVAVARERLGDDVVHHVVLAEAAPLLGQEQPEEAVGRQRLQGDAREGERGVVLGGARPDLLLANLDQALAQRLLLVRQKPVGLEELRIQAVHVRLGHCCHVVRPRLLALRCRKSVIWWWLREDRPPRAVEA